MPSHFRLSLDVDIADDTDFQRSFFELQQSVLDGTTFALGDGKPVDIDHGDTEVINLQQIATGGLLVVHSTRQVTMKLTNGADLDQKVTIGPASDKEGLLVMIGVWTGLKIENQSGQTARVLVGFAGNPAS